MTASDSAAVLAMTPEQRAAYRRITSATGRDGIVPALIAGFTDHSAPEGCRRAERAEVAHTSLNRARPDAQASGTNFPK